MSIARARIKTAARRVSRLVRRGPRPAVLMYHRIGSETFDPWGLAVERERFAEQIEWLARNRAVLPLGEFAQRHRERKLPPDSTALTFDDGYASVLAAAPVLEKHRLQATVFLPIELIERDRPFWWDELARLVIDWEDDALSIGETRLSVPPTDEQDRFWAPDTPPRTARQKLFELIWSKLHAMGPDALEAAMTQIRDRAIIGPGVMDRPLTAEQVRAGNRSTFTFGSHGLTHASLPNLSDEETAREIGESRRRCEDLTGAPPAAFAYPFGDLDTVSVRLVEEAGYACACATGDRFVTSRSDRFALPRLRVGNWDVAGLRDMLGA